MGDIDEARLDAEAFQKFVCSHELVFEQIENRAGPPSILVRVYEEKDPGMVEQVRIAGGQLDGTEAQFMLFMNVVAREFYTHWRRRRMMTKVGGI
jgi:hypothetical protein